MSVQTLDYKAIFQHLESVLEGDVFNDPKTLKEKSTDLGNCQIMPQIVVFPKNSEDVQKLVKFISENASKGNNLSVTARSAGIDVTGGPLNDSIILDTSKYMNEILQLSNKRVVVQPGKPFHELDDVTKEHQSMLPSYPASRDWCSVGGMVGNNSGGEKSYAYGKTEEFVEALKVVLRDGNEYTFRALNEAELRQKMAQDDFEGRIYSEMFQLIDENYDLLQKAKPTVTKNSAGYYLWNVWDRDKKVFDLTRLFTGSQGTLGMVTEITSRLVPFKPCSKLLVIFLDDVNQLPDIIHAIEPFKPEEFEMYHRSAFEMIIRHFPDYMKTLHENPFTFGYKFMPEFFDFVAAGFQPEYFILPKFSGFTMDEVDETLHKAEEAIKKFSLQTHITESKSDIDKYKEVRHKTFYFFRKPLSGNNEVLFFDDICVHVDQLPDVFPKLLELLKPYNCEFFMVSHVGNANIHFVPFLDMTAKETPDIIRKLSHEVHQLVLDRHGSVTGEHNDGLVRTPFLKDMYGEEVYNLFRKTKAIFDPDNIFNPGKKVATEKTKTLDFALNHLKYGKD